MTNSAVIDASLALRAVLPQRGETELDFLQQLIQSGQRLFAPDLWKIEITSAIRRFEHRQLISADEADWALRDAMSLPVEFVSTNAGLCQQAFNWSRRLGQSKAYDALYLAVAIEQNADFWTTDERFIKACHTLNLLQVKSIPLN